MSRILCYDSYQTLIELSSTCESGYRWIAPEQLVAQMSDGGVALCRVDASEDERAVTRLFLNHEEMAALIEAYQTRLQEVQARLAAQPSADNDLGSLDDHPF
jgi:hypothetical protein